MRTGKRALAATLLGLLIGTSCLCGAVESAAPPAADTAVPDLSAWKGKVVYVDFWASWCVPCRLSFPWMNAMHDRYAKDGLVVVAVNMDQSRADAEKFLSQYPASFLVRFDPKGKLAQGFKLRGMPTSALLDRDGKVLQIHEGFRGKDPVDLEASIRAALH
jgi:cytochrome c biogenesis protein CcmG, thiol:disulfide interchange protein DsbE